MRSHLLVTNDYPPKIGGIQNYLWELWRRLPPSAVTVYTTPYQGADRFDADQNYQIGRSREPVLIPYPWLPRRVNELADQCRAELVVLDPALPLGLIGPFLRHRYAVVVHGAEMTIPGRIPGLSRIMARVLRGASLVISAGRYPLAEAERCAGGPLPSVVVPPGVDTHRFRPATEPDRDRLRARLGVGDDDVVLATVSRLVPRKGMDTLIRAGAEVERRRLAAGRTTGRLVIHIAGAGRERGRLERLIARTGAPVELMGRIDDASVVELYQAADLMAMLCNERWFGLEQEGFGIVFLEAAACGLPQVAGRSGGAHEAVEHDVTGLIVDHPTDVAAAADAIEALVTDPDRRAKMGRAARERAVSHFRYDLLADSLAAALDRAMTS